MALRSSWEGFLRLSLISIPVRAYNASAPGGGDIHFHQIHAPCGNRIKYQKVCPVHGEVSKDEIVSGYEYEKGKYILIEPQELSKLRTESDKAINIQAFIKPDALDPVYLRGRTYYLVPDGPPGQKPYAVLHRVMAHENRYAVAQVVISGREETVLVRPLQKLLAISVLSYAHQVKQPSAFEDQVEDVKVTPEELKLAENLIDASTVEDFDFSKYKDPYTERVTELIEAKAAGKRITGRRKHEEPVVINLMEALRKSLDRAKHPVAAESNGSAHRRHARPGRRKKTG